MKFLVPSRNPNTSAKAPFTNTLLAAINDRSSTISLRSSAQQKLCDRGRNSLAVEYSGCYIRFSFVPLKRGRSAEEI
ncbi:hypothetical protein AYO50_02300 [Acidobacteria bacterium SCGC AG-212-P17]|nr:hypothetical protein AYO50_02300 [Acidobacteria bacterium SCGC AG-212-P17]